METNKTNTSIHNQSSESKPMVLLSDLCAQQASGQLVVTHNSVKWFIDLELGKINYITNSIEPLDRLYGYLWRKGISLTEDIRTQLNHKKSQSTKPIDSEILLWLVRQKKITFIQLTEIMEEITKEVFESLSWLEQAQCEFSPPSERTLNICKFDLSTLIEHAKERLDGWQNLGLIIWSPYQRLYFFNQGKHQQEKLPELPEKFRTLLKGHSLRRLSAIINRDELDLARSLVPYIRGQVIHLGEPQAPFNLLPRLPILSKAQTIDELVPETTYTIACIDDSPTITNEISRCLGDPKYSVTAINDPVKALMQITRIKPDLILLDVGMPMIDGYELCRLLRKNPLFKKTPIVMVTGNTGFFDRARATLVGSSDYLTKPFTKEGLLKTVNRHLEM